MNSARSSAFEDVAYLRTHQFAEDAGPMAHPVRPDSFIEISNFYTLTVYEKGAEVVGMIHTLLGAEGFRKGSDLYFERHDGQAVTCDDFIKAMEDANGVDLTQFKRWYSQAGTPRLAVSESYDAAAKTYSLTFRQSCPPTPDKVEKLPFVIPVELGLLDAKATTCRCVGRRSAPGHQPCDLGDRSRADLHLRRHRRTAAAVAAARLLGAGETELPVQPRPADVPDAARQRRLQPLGCRPAAVGAGAAGTDRPAAEGRSAGARSASDHGLGTVLSDESLDQAMVAEMLSLPGEAYLTEISEVADVEAIHAAREFARQQIAEHLFEALWLRYQANRDVSRRRLRGRGRALRPLRLQNIALSYLMLSGKPRSCRDPGAVRQRDNMTERLTALAVLVNSPFEAERPRRWKLRRALQGQPAGHGSVVQRAGGSTLPGGLARVKALMQHPAFTMKNPNKVRALVGAFAGQNLVNFHAADGSGYRFLADLVIELNG
jgi:aminopeptidase N